jgi:hypothetical protein
MGITLSLDNIENFVFSNNRVIASLPKHKDIFDSWMLSKRVPHLRNLNKKSLMDFLQVVDEEELEIISIINKINITNVDKNLVRFHDIVCKPEELEFKVEKDLNIMGLALYRGKEEVKLFIWK